MAKIDTQIGKRKEIKFLFLSAVVVTIFVNPLLADPFNAPKLYILILASSWLAGFIISDYKKNKNFNSENLLILIFVLTFFIITLATDHKYTALFGESQRQLGFFTYLAFAIYMLVGANSFTFEQFPSLIKSTSLLSVFFITYGLLQYSGNDLINWINQYNPIIVSLGNPNFAAAFMAILAVFSFSLIFYQKISLQIRIFQLFLFIGLLLTIYLSDAKQGIISLSVGLFVFINLILVNRNKWIGYTTLFASITFGIFVICGMLQKGPLVSMLYKDSVSLRGFYWRAGLNMFKDNVLTGVGIDRYGANFKLYREPGYSLRYGYELTSTNAHNTFIQFFATGGVFLGVLYLLIILSIAIGFATTFKKVDSINQVIYIGLFSSWVAYLSQSFVSIDNIGLTIWGWIFGGIILGIARQNKTSIAKKLNKSHILFDAKNSSNYRLTLSLSILILAFTIVINLSQSETRIIKVREYFSNLSQSNSGIFKIEVDKLISDKWAQPVYKLEVADYLIRVGLRNEGLKVLSNLYQQDPKNPVMLNAIAVTYESNKDFRDAIKYRKLLENVDPYNAKNFAQMALLFREIGNITESQRYKDKVLAFAPNSELSKSISAEIKD